MDKNKLCVILYRIASVCFYVTAIFNFIASNSLIGAVYTCLGSCFLCLGFVYKKRIKKDSQDDRSFDKGGRN